MYRSSQALANRAAVGPSAQRGVVLAVSLILLVVMTLVAVTAMSVNSQQESMASNTRQRNLAFQSAETCIREAEIVLERATLPSFDGTEAGYRTSFEKASSGDMLDYCWTGQEPGCTSAASAEGVRLAQLAAPCRFVIEELRLAAPVTGASVKLGPIETTSLYRVTALGIGGTADAVAIVQTLYRR